MTDIIVVGGGIMGLLTARELARAGRQVLLLEKGQPGAGTTWASAGIVSPHGSSGSADIAGEPGLRLRHSSFGMWQGLAEAVREESGMDLEYRLTGLLLLAMNREEASEIQEKAKTRQWGDTKWLEPENLRSEEPALATGLAGALFVQGGNVEARRVGPALEIACRRLGVEIRTSEIVAELVTEENKVRGVRTGSGEFFAPTVVICAGIGSRGVIGARPIPPIVPQRGQVIALDARGLTLRHTVLRITDPYFVPRADGRLIIGATREFAGEDPRLTAGGLGWLLTSAIETIPALESAPILETWTGFRPLCSDHLPMIGAGEPQGVYFCTGHGPTGITPAPISAALVTSLITGTKPTIDPAPYDPMRFT